MGGGLSRKREAEEMKAAQLDMQAEVLAAKDKSLRAKDKAVKQLRRQVRELIRSKAASDAALHSAEAKQAVAEAASFASTCAGAQKASQVVQLQEELSSATQAARHLERELASLTAEVSRMKSQLETKASELCRTQSMLREARVASEGWKSTSEKVMEEADGKVREVQAIHSNVSFLRAKLVSMYLSEFAPSDTCHAPNDTCQGRADQHCEVATQACMFHAELDPRIHPELCLASGLYGISQGGAREAVPPFQPSHPHAKCRSAWR